MKVNLGSQDILSKLLLNKRFCTKPTRQKLGSDIYYKFQLQKTVFSRDILTNRQSILKFENQQKFVILNTKAHYKKFPLKKNQDLRNSRHENLVNRATETYVAIKQQQCCVTLTTVENM